MNKIKIVEGIEEPLENVPNHSSVSFLERILLSNADIFPEIGAHVAVHYINISDGEKVSEYTQPHAHNVPEINFILSQDKQGLSYEIYSDGEKHIVDSPATVFIPTGVSHSARAVKGRGMYFCIVGDGNYRKSLEK